MTTRIGESDVDAAADTDCHFTGEGVAGAGGKFAGARTVWVAASKAVGRLGGMMKCSCSSLRTRVKILRIGTEGETLT